MTAGRAVSEDVSDKARSTGIWGRRARQLSQPPATRTSGGNGRRSDRTAGKWRNQRRLARRRATPANAGAPQPNRNGGITASDR